MKALLPALILVATVAAQPARPPITGLAHAAFFVSSMEPARAFYTRYLGFSESSPGVIQINDRQSVELLNERAPNTDRLDHIAIETTDTAALRAYLAAKGIKVPAHVNPDRTFTVTDPDNHTVEFVERRSPAEPLPDARISKYMAHYGILVGSLAASRKFYGDLLGFEETWRGSREGKALDWTNMKVPNGDDYIEFMLYTNIPEPTKRGSAHHICLFVPDIEKSAAELKTRPGYTRPLEIRTGVNRKRQLNLFDPDGTRTELMEPRTIDGTPTPSSNAPPPR